jgi:uncharacterized protein YfeS
LPIIYTTPNIYNMDDEKYGIDINNAHQRAIELIPEDFFWSCIDDLAPFGSDEGDMALLEFRNWRKENPTTPTIECLKWVIESVGEMDFADYNASLASKEKIRSQLEDEEFDSRQFIWALDVSVIATGFAQLVDEGMIAPENKDVIQIANDRQVLFAKEVKNWDNSVTYLSNLRVLERVLEAA